VLIGAGAVSSLAVGIPLLATSADGQSIDERRAELADERAVQNGPVTMASPGMFATGVTLTSLGGVCALSGAVVVASADHDIGAGLGGMALLGGSLLFLGPGIPLTIVGGRDVPAGAAQAAVPVVHFGPGSIDVRGNF